MEVEKLINGIIDYVKKNEDIDGLVVYGSYVTKTYNEYSDVDFYFIPREKDFQACHQFIINDIGYDLWPIPWERLKSLSKLEEPMMSLLGDGVMVYSKNDDIEKRFIRLKNILEENLASDEMINEKLKETLLKIKSSAYSYLTSRMALDDVLQQIHNYVALNNHTYVHKSAIVINEEAYGYKKLPRNFLSNFKESLHSDDALFRLIGSLEEAEVFNPDYMNGFYEEIKSAYNKVLHGLKTKDQMKIFFSVSSIDREVRHLLKESYDSYDFPNLLDLYDDEKLEDHLIQHENILLSIINKYNIEINSFVSLDDYLTWLEER